LIRDVVAPCCVTLIVLLTTDDPSVVVTVMVPLLDDVDVFSATRIVKEPLFDPLEGDSTLSQDEPEVAAADHDVFELTVIDVVSIEAEGFQYVCDTVRVGAVPCCVTGISLVIDPALTVTVPFLGDTDVFSLA